MRQRQRPIHRELRYLVVLGSRGCAQMTAVPLDVSQLRCDHRGSTMCQRQPPIHRELQHLLVAGSRGCAQMTTVRFDASQQRSHRFWRTMQQHRLPKGPKPLFASGSALGPSDQVPMTTVRLDVSQLRFDHCCSTMRQRQTPIHRELRHLLVAGSRGCAQMTTLDASQQRAYRFWRTMQQHRLPVHQGLKPLFASLSALGPSDQVPMTLVRHSANQLRSRRLWSTTLRH